MPLTRSLAMLLAVAAALLAAATAGHALAVVTNGAALDNEDGTYVLIADQAVDSGSIFYKPSFRIKNAAGKPLDVEFKFTFEFAGFCRDYLPACSDGFTAVIHADPRGNTALGGLGADLGYSGDGALTNALAVEFDITLNPEKNDADDGHIAILPPGTTAHPLPLTGWRYQTVPDLLNKKGTVWINYAAGSKRFNVFVAFGSTTKPATPLLQLRGLDLSARLGGATRAFIGFTAGSGTDEGGFSGVITDWTARTFFPPPPPKSIKTATFSDGSTVRKVRKEELSTVDGVTWSTFFTYYVNHVTDSTSFAVTVPLSLTYDFVLDFDPSVADFVIVDGQKWFQWNVPAAAGTTATYFLQILGRYPAVNGKALLTLASGATSTVTLSTPGFP